MAHSVFCLGQADSAPGFSGDSTDASRARQLFQDFNQAKDKALALQEENKQLAEQIIVLGTARNEYVADLADISVLPLILLLFFVIPID